MKFRFSYYMIVLFVLSASALFAVQPQIEHFKGLAGKKIKVVGTLRLVGNEPFTRLTVRTTNNIDVYFTENLNSKYNDLQGEMVSAEGILIIKKIESADHKIKFTEYKLSNAVLENISINPDSEDQK